MASAFLSSLVSRFFRSTKRTHSNTRRKGRLVLENLEARLNPAPMVLVPKTSALDPLGVIQGNLNLTGVLQVDLAD